MTEPYSFIERKLFTKIRTQPRSYGEVYRLAYALTLGLNSDRYRVTDNPGENKT